MHGKGVLTLNVHKASADEALQHMNLDEANRKAKRQISRSSGQPQLLPDLRTSWKAALTSSAALELEWTEDIDLSKPDARPSMLLLALVALKLFPNASAPSAELEVNNELNLSGMPPRSSCKLQVAGKPSVHGKKFYLLQIVP